MKLRWLFGALLAGVALAVPAAAQQVVGTALVNGRPVQIMSDFTWRYTSPTAANCKPVQDKVSFCGEDSGWKRTASGGGDAAAMYRLNDRTYGLFIVEAVGAEDGISQTAMRSIILDNAANLAGGAGKDIPIIGVESDAVDGVTGETVIYLAKSEGLSFVFLNTVVIDKRSTIQVVTYNVGGNITDEMRATHKRFLAATRLK